MKLTLVEKRNEFPDVITFIFKPDQILNFKAGQFLHYKLPHLSPDDRGIDRYFTIAAAPYEEVARITTRFTNERGSSFKGVLHNLKVGDIIEAEGPLGEFTVEDPSKNYVFIAGGIGITPFRAILLQLRHENKPINMILLYANRDQNIVFKDELESLIKNNPNFKIIYIFSPEHVDEKKIKETVPNLSDPIFYVSGPEPMVNNMVEILKKMNIQTDHIKKDWFPGYKEI